MATPNVLSTAAVAVGSVLVPITFENTAASVQTNVPVTFGQVFAKGQFPNSTPAVELKAPDNSVVPCQLDVKATHTDGSVKHAVLSAIIPSLAASATVIYSIVRKAAPLTGTPATPASFPTLNAITTITDTGTAISGPGAGTVYTADAAARLAAGTYETWLSGPIVSEWIVRVPLVTSAGAVHPDLHARFSIRAYKGQSRAKVDCIVENTWAKPLATPTASTPWETVSISPVIYGYSIKIAGTVVDARATSGYHRARLTNPANTFNGTATGLANDSTAYTATIVVDGVSKAVSVVGSSVQNFSQLYAAITSQMGGAATCTLDEGNLGLRITSATTGANSSVVISPGTLFPALGYPSAYRPIRGDEHIHYAQQRWKKTFWWNGEPTVHVKHDKVYLIDSLALPNYPKTLAMNPTTIASNLATMKANEDLGRNGMTKQIMSGFGYAPSIGILPEWVALYVLDQGKDSKYVMLKQADLAGSWSHVVREYDTDKPLDLAKWPYATFSPNANDSKNPATNINEKLPSGVSITGIPGNPNQADVAHHPDFFFVPYMVTGDHFYMEGLLFYQVFTCLNMNAAGTYRDGGKCLFKGDSQTRSQAWSMRTLAHNRYLLPDSHPNRPALNNIAAANVQWYNDNFVSTTGAKWNPFGNFQEFVYAINGISNVGTGTFQEDFAAQALGRCVELGFEEFLPLFTFKSAHIKGRLTSGTDYCWQWATSYAMRYRATTGGTSYTTWKEVYDNTIAYETSAGASVLTFACGSTEMGAVTEGVNTFPGYPNWLAGRAANMQPAVAYCAMFNMPGGQDAWLVYDAAANNQDFENGPQFDILPRTFSTTSVVTPPAPQPSDVYYGITGTWIYGGRAAPAVVTGFDSVTNFVGSANSGVPGTAQNAMILNVELHGSSGSNGSTGRQYRAAVSGYMALNTITDTTASLGYEAATTFGYSVVIAYSGDHIKLRPIDKWGTWPNGSVRESAHQGFVLSSDNKFHLISERRYDAMLDWAVANLPYDPKKYVLSGGSMGGWGTISYGVRRYARFAALYPDRPRWRNGYSAGFISPAFYDNGFVATAAANSPVLAPEDGGGTLYAYNDMITYVANTANKVRWIGWLCGKNDGYTPFQDHIDAVAAMRAGKRGFAFAWNNGGHDTGPATSEITQSYPYGTFVIGKGYPLFTEHSLDKDPAVDLVGGINIGLAFRNVVETASGWSCEVTNVLGACTVKAEPISDTFTKAVAKQLITIPAASTWVPVSFS